MTATPDPETPWPVADACAAGPLCALGDGRVWVDVDTLELLEVEVGSRAARLLVHMLREASTRRGRVLVRTSERELVRQMSEFGDGWSRKPVAAGLDALEEAGLVRRQSPGVYELNPQLVAGMSTGSESSKAAGSRQAVDNQSGAGVVSALAPGSVQSGVGSGPAAVPLGGRDGSDGDRVGSREVPRSPVMSSDDLRMTVHDQGQEFATRRLVAECVAFAAESGVRGDALDLVAADPRRGAAWVVYAQAKHAVDPSCSVGGYVNSMMRKASPDGAGTWPPRTDSGKALDVVLVDGRVQVRTQDGEPWVPPVGTRSRSPKAPSPPVTLAAIEQALLDGLHGARWDEDEQFLEEAAAASAAAAQNGVDPRYVPSVGKLRALQSRGILTDRRLPDSFLLPTAARF